MDIRVALIYGTDYTAQWDRFKPDGMGLIVVSRLPNGRAFIAHLLPVDISEGIWVLKTAYQLKK